MKHEIGSIRRFRHDPTRFERSQQRVHRREFCSYMTCHGLGPLLIYDRRLNSLIYSKNIYQEYFKNFLLNNLKRFSTKKTMLPLMYHI